MKIRKGDRVQVLTGKDRGKQGVVLRAMPAEDKDGKPTRVGYRVTPEGEKFRISRRTGGDV